MTSLALAWDKKRDKSKKTTDKNKKIPTVVLWEKLAAGVPSSVPSRATPREAQSGTYQARSTAVMAMMMAMMGMGITTAMGTTAEKALPQRDARRWAT
jgi:hypothetical protein